MINFMAVLIGGGLGAVTRYMFITNSVFAGAQKILIVNTLGSFLMGFLFELFKGLGLPIFLEKFLVVGFIGGFTAFSAYSLDVVRLLLDLKFKQPILYVLLVNIMAFAAVFIGMVVSKYLKLLLLNK